MSRKIEQEVWDYSNAKASALLVLVCIANDAADATREAIIPIKDLMRLTRLAERTVYYNLNKLEEMGDLQVLGDRHTPAAYRVREYIATDGYLDGRQLNVFEQHYQQSGNIKDPARQRAIQAKRSSAPKRRRRT